MPLTIKRQRHEGVQQKSAATASADSDLSRPVKSLDLP
jgi:hypothetical protein